MSLIERCNGQSAFGNACNTAASASKNFLEFAGTLQVLRKTFWSLQERCKYFEKLFGVCRNAASISRDVLANCETSVETLCWLCSYVKLTLTRSCFEFIE